MEDYIKREIDKFGEMLLALAGKMGLHLEKAPQYPLSDLTAEMKKAELSFDLEELLAREYPVLYLVEHEKISDQGLEVLTELIFHSDLDENKKKAFLEDAINYLDNKGNYSFRHHSLWS